MRFFNVQSPFQNYCIIEKNMTTKNYLTITRHTKRLLDYLRTDNIRKVNENNIREYLSFTSTQKAWSPKTYRSHLQSLVSFYKWCVIQGYVKKNPAAKIEKPKLPKRLPRCLTQSQAQTIIEYAIQYPWLYKFERTRNITIIYTFLYTGMRLNELLHLRVSDLNLDSQEIYVNRGKGGKNRIIPVHPDLSSVLRGFLEMRNDREIFSKWLFTGIHSDKRLYEKNVLEICRKISIKSGIKFTPHMLRHTFARLMCDADLNLYKLKEILGHSNVSTTQIYLSVSKEGIKRSLGNITIL